MKKILCLISLLSATAALSAYADNGYMVLRVCQDQHVIRTSDGADAGHLGYVLIDPDSGQLVSAVVTGGVLGDRCVPLPIADVRFGTDADVTLTSIDREHLMDAPVIDTTRFTSTTVIQPDTIENSYRHFGADLSSIRGGGQGGRATLGATRENAGAGNPDQGVTRENQRDLNDRNRASAAFGGSQINNDQNRPNESGANATGTKRGNRSDENTPSENHRMKNRENAQSPESRSEMSPSRATREEGEQHIGGATTEGTPSTTRAEKESTSEKAGQQMDSEHTRGSDAGTRLQSDKSTSDRSLKQDKQSDTGDQSR